MCFIEVLVIRIHHLNLGCLYVIPLRAVCTNICCNHFSFIFIKITKRASSSGEHTAKNIMITAQKIQTKRSDEWLQDRRQKLISLAELYGIKRQRLATLMGESIVVGSGGREGNKKSKIQKNLSGMAPL